MKNRFSSTPSLGQAQYRTGRNKEAVQTHTKAAAAGEDRAGTWLYLAMAHHNLGNVPEAKKWLSKAQLDDPTAIPSWPWQAQVGLPIVRREAEKLIGGK